MTTATYSTIIECDVVSAIRLVQSTEEENQNSLFSHFTVELFGRGGINCHWYDKAIKLLSEQCYEDSILEVETVLWQKSFSLRIPFLTSRSFYPHSNYNCTYPTARDTTVSVTCYVLLGTVSIVALNTQLLEST